MGLGKPGLPTIGFLVPALINLGLSIALARPLGLAGVAIGTAVPNVLFAALILWQACHELGTPVGQDPRYVVPRAAVGVGPVGALLLGGKNGLDVRTLPAVGG